MAMGEKRSPCKISIGIPEGKRPLRRYRSRWEGNIKLDLKETEWKVSDWIHLAWDR
jgi:hypothetical protein